MRRYAAPAVVFLVLGACAAETTVSPTTGAEAKSTTSTSATASADSTTTLPPTTTSQRPEIDVEIREGEVTGTDRFEYRTGETVSITVVADTAYELHVHGYDLRYDLVIDEPFTVEFIADVPGIFEVETHPDHLLAFEIEVGG